MDGLIGTRLYQITPITHITRITPNPWPESKDKIIPKGQNYCVVIIIMLITQITHITPIWGD